MFRRLIVIGSLLMPLTLCGCSNMFTPMGPKEYDYRLSNSVHPVFESGLVVKANTANPDYTRDPIMDTNDPITTPDPMKGRGSLAGDDPLTRNPTEGSDRTNRPINNWYWVKGTIANGAITLKVNGMTIGRFSVKVDTEISDYLNKGSNDITFVSEPTVPDQPVEADLTVVYAQQQPGDPPVLTYNTLEDGNNDAPPPTTYGKPSPDIPGVPLPSVNPTAPSASPDGTSEQTLSFIAT